MIIKRSERVIVGFLALMTLVTFGTEALEIAFAENIQKQIVKLQSGTPKQKIEAAEIIGRMGSKGAEAVPYLIALLDSSEKYERISDKIWNAANPLGGAGRSVLYESQQALTKIGRPAVQPLTAALLKHPRARVRGNAALVLGHIRDLQSQEALVESLKTDGEWTVRMWSAEALGRLAEVWSIQSLDPAARALMGALGDRDPNVRQKAAYALGTMKAVAAVPALIEALQAYGRNSDAGLALFMITGQRFGNDAEKWQQWWTKQVR